MTARRILTLAGALALLAAFGWWAFGPRAIRVESAPVTTGAFTALIEESGRTQVKARYTVAAPLAGRLLRMALRAGDTVSEGMRLATLRAAPPALIDARARRELEERIGAAEASLDESVQAFERARTLLAKAKLDLERTRQLRASGAASLAQLERDTFAHETAAQDLAIADRHRQAAGHALALARAAFFRGNGAEEEFIPINAPVAGQVLKVHQESETVVAAGAALVEIGDPAAIEISVDLLTTMAVRVRPGARVAITGWGGAQPLAGRVRRVEPSGFVKLSTLGVEEQRVRVLIDITSPPAEFAGLADGYRVEVAIATDEIADAVIVPAGALFRRDERWHVFVVREGRARMAPVEIGLRSGRMASIAAGLSPGERVVLYPPSAVREGARVVEK